MENTEKNDEKLAEPENIGETSENTIDSLEQPPLKHDKEGIKASNGEEEEPTSQQTMDELEPQKVIKIKIKAQLMEKLISINEKSSIAEMKAVIASKFGTTLEQVCLIFDGKMLENNETLLSLNIEDNSTVHLIIKMAETSEGHYCPSQYARLGIGRTDFVQLQKEMQKQLSSNTNMVKQMVNNPLVQQLMANPDVMKQLIMNVPQAKEMLEKHPDISSMLDNPESMKASLNLIQDPGQLQDLLSKMVEDNQGPTETPVKVQLPSTQAMLRLMAQDSQSIHTMLQAPYLQDMLQGFETNPGLAKELIMNNSLLSTNTQLQKQMVNMLPSYIKQMKNEDVKLMMENPKALQAMLRIQRGIQVLQQEAPHVANGAGLAYLSTAPNLDDNISAATGDEDAAKQLDGEAKPLQADAATLIMSQIVQQMGSNKLKRPIDERYTEQLDLMESMGFPNRTSNLQFLVQSFGNVDAAVTQLISQQET